MEKAYHQKCIDLKRRLNEIEEANDSARIRKRRLDRAIMKMRIERALLLDQLAKAQDLNFEDSGPDSSGPPTVKHFKSTPSPDVILRVFLSPVTALRAPSASTTAEVQPWTRQQFHILRQTPPMQGFQTNTSILKQ